MSESSIIPLDDDLTNLPQPMGPISSQELSNLQSLLDPKSNNKALTGTQVMVPLTTKAFFRGTLQPPSSLPSSSSDKATLSMKEHKHDKNKITISNERVLMNLGQGYLAEMTRGEASDVIRRRRLEAFQTKSDIPSSPSKTTIKSKNTATAKTKKKSLDTRRTSNASMDENETNLEEESLAALPFFEIREEYDEFGNEIKSEAVNVADKLKYLQSEVKQKQNETGNGNGSDDDDDDDDDLLNQMVQNISTSDAMVSDKIHHGDSSSQVDEALVEQTDNPAKSIKHISDDTFQSMLSRFDELAKLEETTEKNRKVNLRSSKKLQSKGWAKGFLTNDSKKKKSSKSKKVNDNNQTKILAAATATATATATVDSKPEKRTKSVVIKEENNEVKHIPKIGNRSINSIKSPFHIPPAPVRIPAATTATTTNTTTASTKMIPPQSKAPLQSFGKDAFTGIITEKKSKSNYNNATNGEEAPQKKLSRFAQQRQQQQQQQDATTNLNEVPKKKLSRFAQQRQQGF